MNSPDSLALAPLEFGGSKRTSRALENSLKLGEYLSRQLHFRTQTILEGLKKLANYESRTYYFQKYSSSRLANVKFVWKHERFVEIDRETHERLCEGIRLMHRDGLVVYLIGVEQGAFKHKDITYLVGAIGTELTHETNISEQIKQFRSVGINSLLLIPRKEEDLSYQQIDDYYSDFKKRGWLQRNAEFKAMADIRNRAGRVICRLCRTTRCTCPSTEKELSNIQGFI